MSFGRRREFFGGSRGNEVRRGSRGTVNHGKHGMARKRGGNMDGRDRQDGKRRAHAKTLRRKEGVGVAGPGVRVTVGVRMAREEAIGVGLVVVA